MTADWWELADEWLRSSAPYGMGDVGARRAEFASRRKPRLSAVTVARADSARRFAERLARQDRLSGAEVLRHVPVTFVAALSRIERYSPAVVDKLLPDVIAGKLEGADLRREEEDAREMATIAHDRAVLGLDRASTAASDATSMQVDAPTDLGSQWRPLDGYSLRSRSRHFVDRVMGCLTRNRPLPGVPPIRVRPDIFAAPLLIDAIVVLVAGREPVLRGVRAYPAAATDADRKRLSAAVLLGMLASRVLEEYVAIFERQEDAIEVARMLSPYGRSGAGVAWLDVDDRLHVLHKADRDARPDLHGVFGNVLEQPSGKVPVI